MIEPSLWGENTNCFSLVHKEYVTKIKHLIKWKENESIYEFGIGDGSNTKTSLLPILPKGYKEFIGSDVSTQMVEFVKSNMTDPRMKFVVLDISCKNIPEEFVNRFDHIFGFLVMHWVKDTRQALQNMYRMLKPNGQLFLTYVDETSADRLYFILSHHPKWGKYDHKRLISPFFCHRNPSQAYKEILEETGFKECYNATEKRVCQFSDEAAFEGFCLSVNPIFREVPKEDYEEYKQEFVKGMTNNNLNFTTKCPETGKDIYNTTLLLNVVLLEKNENHLS